MRNICFYFQVHQPFRLRNYSFFNIGKSSDYFDEGLNKMVLDKVAAKCYLPTNALLLDLINEHKGKFKVCYSISGVAIDQFEQYKPEVLDSFKKLADTGCVEFLGETYAHSLSVLKSSNEFASQVEKHGSRMESLFNQKPKVFRNTELIYSDKIGNIVYNMGFRGMLAEGAARVLGWRSPNYLYCNAQHPGLKLLLKNFRLSDDIAFRFSNRDWSEWPLKTEKFVKWLNEVPPNDEIINLFLDYETFGEHQWAESGIFDFLKKLPKQVFSRTNYKFITPSEAVETLQPAGLLSMPDPVSWADEERDLSAWLGNDLQDDVFENLYALEQKVKACRNNENIQRDWMYLQTSDHFYYMCTKFFADGDVHKYFNHYKTPYDAYINYMNVLTDFSQRIDKELEKQTHTKVDIPIIENVLAKNKESLLKSN